MQSDKRKYPIPIGTVEEFKRENGGEVSQTFIHFNLPPKQLQRLRDSAAKKSQTGQQESNSADTKDDEAKAR